MEIGSLPPETQLTTDNKVTIRECEETITTIEIVDAYKLVQNNASVVPQNTQETPKTFRLTNIFWAPWKTLKSFLLSSADERCWCESEQVENPQTLSVVSGQVVSGDDPSLVFTIRTPMRVRHVAVDNQSYIDSLNRLLSRRHETTRHDVTASTTTMPDGATNIIADQNVVNPKAVDQNVNDSNVIDQNNVDQKNGKANAPSDEKIIEPLPAIPSPTVDPQNPSTDQLSEFSAGLRLPSQPDVDRNSTSGSISALTASETASGQSSGARSSRKSSRTQNRDGTNQEDGSYLTIRIGDETFQVERSVFVTKSELLSRLHSYGYLKHGKICIQGIKANIFWTLVRYILTNDINLNPENYRPIRACAKKLEIRDLLDKCSEFRGRHRKYSSRSRSARVAASCTFQADQETDVTSPIDHQKQSTTASSRCLRFFVNANRSLCTESLTTGSLEPLSNYDTIQV